MPLSIKPSDLIMNKPVGFVSSASSRVKIGINSRLSSRMTSCCPSQHNLACESDISFCSANTAPLPYRKDLFWDMGMLQSRLSSTAILNKWVAHNSQRRRIAESFHRDIPRLARLISNTKVNITKSIDGKPEVIHSSTALARLNKLCPVEEEEEKILVNNDGFFTPPCTSMTFIGSDNGHLGLSLNPTLTPDIFNALRNQVIILDGMVRSNRNQLAIEAPVNHHVAEHQYIAQGAVSNDLCLKSNDVAKLEDITVEIDKNHQLFPAISHSETTTSLNSAEPTKETQSEEKLVEIAQNVVQGAIKSAVKIVNSVPALNDTSEKSLVETAQLIVQDISAHNMITSEAQTGGVNDDIAKINNQDAVNVKPKGEYVACKVKPIVAPKPSKEARVKKMVLSPSPKLVGGGKMLGKKVACGDVTQKFCQNNNVLVVQSAFIDDCPIRQGSTRRKIQHFENMRLLFETDQGKAKTNDKSYGMRQSSSLPLNESDVTLNDEQHSSPDVEENNLTRQMDVSSKPEQQKAVSVEEDSSDGLFHDAISDIYSIQEIQRSGSSEAVANHEVVDGVESLESNNNTKAYDDVGEVKNSIFIRDIDSIQELQWSGSSEAVANHEVADGVESLESNNNTKAYDDVREVKNSIFIRDIDSIQELPWSGSSAAVANHEVVDGVESLESNNNTKAYNDVREVKNSIFIRDIDSIQELQWSDSSGAVANHEVADGVESLESNNNTKAYDDVGEVKNNILIRDIDNIQEFQWSGSSGAVANQEVADGVESLESDKDTKVHDVVVEGKNMSNSDTNSIQELQRSGSSEAVANHEVAEGVESVHNVRLYDIEGVKHSICNSVTDSIQDELQLSGSSEAVKNKVADGTEALESDNIPNDYDTNATNLIKHDKKAVTPKTSNETTKRPDIVVDSNTVTQSAVPSRPVGFFRRLLRRLRHRIRKLRRRRRTSTPTGADEHQDATANDDKDDGIKNEANDDYTSKDVADVIL
ncbi:uncharacterized protein LOC117108035 [Anneissia japonica]|uniref:uncharacterized protein LOC117108035 n=1 Tax=Anneissia japonica TaxID=1529436 RepID=UPI00142597E4|nr:uncharacterized protein LOC117108035 [Anneissia japonica]